MRLECRSRTAISCDSRERREQHFRRPAEKADRFWSAPRKRTPRPDAAGMPIAPRHFLCRPRETRAAFQTTGRKSGQVLVRTQKANTPARRGWNADSAQPFLVIAARDASSISDDRQKKRTGFGPHPESEHPGQTRLECRSRTAISCDSHEKWLCAIGIPAAS